MPARTSFDGFGSGFIGADRLKRSKHIDHSISAALRMPVSGFTVKRFPKAIGNRDL
jgi:hypothetical protein